MMRTVLFAIVVAAGAAAAAACGGKSKPATATEPAGNPDGEQHEHSFPPEMGAFHDKLAPLWHADEGQPRVDQTCGATGELDALATGVKNATPPAGVDPARYGERATALLESITKLSATCGSADRATFQVDFEAVHSAFHRLIELLPATEEEHKAAEGASELGVDPAGGEKH